MGIKDYPNLGKTQPFGKDPNDGKIGNGNLVFTRFSLKRIISTAFTCTAAITGALYIFNAIDSFGSSNDNNNNKDKRNGK
jgi:hypothetical protein